MVQIFLGLSSHKIATFGLACFSTATVVLATVTGESILLVIGTSGGVALGIISLRDKLRDYRAEALQKQVASLHKQLEDERADHEQTRDRLHRLQAEVDMDSTS